MKYFVTGAGGYVGTLLCRFLLENGHEVLALDNFHKGHCDSSIGLNRFSSYYFQYGDVRNKKDLEYGVKTSDIVVNLAAIVGLNQCKYHSFIVDSINIGGVQNLVDLCNLYSDKVLIQASTDSVFGSVELESDENTTPNPQSHYGTSKLEAEKVILNSTYNYNPIVIRFSTGCGVSDNMRVNLLVNDLVCTALNKKSLEIYEPNVYRSFIDVSDMARSIIHFANLGKNQKNKFNTYCIGENSMNFTKKQLAELVQMKTGCKVSYIDGQDIDKRNYRINHQRMYDSGFKCQIDMSSVIDNLIKTYNQMHFQEKYQ